MANLELKQTPQVKAQLLPRLMGSLKVANLMSLSENKFKKVIQEIEQNPLFKQLTYPENKNEKIISYQRFPHTDISSNFYELKEEIARDRSSFDVESLVAKKKRVTEIIRGIGIDKFKQYFLYNDSDITLQEIANSCGLSIEKVKIVTEFMNQFLIYEEICTPSFSPDKIGARTLENQIHYHKIAAIEKDGKEFIINYFSPSIARGRYSINYKKLEELKKKVSKQEMKRIYSLVNKLELINTRKTTMYQILQSLIKIQYKYLESGEPFNLLPYAQKKLSNQIDTDPSLVCRAIQGKSIIIPNGGEVPLKELLPSRKKITLRLIKEIIAEGKCLTDEEIRYKLNKKANIHLSRRSISQYRKELRIPSKRHREARRDTPSPCPLPRGERIER